MSRAGFLLSLLLAAASPAFADTLLLKNGVVHTVSGETLLHGNVLIQDGKIAQVYDQKSSPQQTIPQDAKVIDLVGQHLYPGMIALDTVLGLTEIEAIRSTQDSAEAGEFRPDVQAWIAVNPDSELLPVTRANGITHIEPSPQGGVVSGMCGLVALDGWTMEQMTVKAPVALNVAWPKMVLNTTPKEKMKDQSKFKSLEDQAKERTAKLKELDDFFQDARAYAKARADKKASLNPPWEAMLPVVRGDVPVMIQADEVRQIKAAVEWARTNKFKIIIAGGRDAWKVAGLLATNQVPVVYESVFDVPTGEENGYDAQFKAPELLRRAGVKVALSTGSSTFGAPMTKNLPYEAAQAVAFGLPEAEAVKGLTLYPAELLGVADRLGSIEAGKEASLFVCDGNILDIRANVKRMWIGGREVSPESRHTRLYEKYKNRPGTK